MAARIVVAAAAAAAAVPVVRDDNVGDDTREVKNESLILLLGDVAVSTVNDLGICIGV